MGHHTCNCCYPSCPVPVLGSCDKGYVRSSSSPATGGGTYSLPAEYVGRKYTQLVESYKTTTDHETRRVTYGHSFSDYLATSSGTVTATRTLHSKQCEYITTLSGSMTSSVTRRTYYDDAGTPSDYVDYQRVILIQGGAGYSDGTSTTEADEFLETTTTDSRSSASDPFTRTVTKVIRNRGDLAGRAQLLSEGVWDDDRGIAVAHTITYTNSPTLHQAVTTAEYDGADPSPPAYYFNGAYTEKLEYSDPFVQRWQITIPHDFGPPPSPHPQKWHGTWHKIELLETFTPSDHDPEDPGSPQPVKTTKTVTWTGPGTELDFDLDGDYTETEQEAIDSWKTDWIEIDPPTTQGTITIEMVRSQCYHGAPWVYH